MCKPFNCWQPNVGLYCVAYLLLFPLMFAGQNSPTYEETRAWIISKIGEDAGSTHPNPSEGYSTESYRDVSMNDCKLRLTDSLFDSFLRSTTTDKISIPLNKDTSVSVERVRYGAQGESIDDYRVRLSTVSKVIAIERTEETADGRITAKKILSLDKTDIVFGRPKSNNADLSKRMEKALTHAIQLCSTPSKEPF